MRNNSSGRPSYVTVNRSGRPEPIRGVAKKSSYLKTDKPDYFKDFKNSLNSILNNYQDKKTMNRREPENESKRNDQGEETKAGNQPEGKQKYMRLTENIKPGSIGVNSLYLSKQKSKSASILKKAPESFINSYIKKSRELSNNLAKGPLNKSTPSIGRILNQGSLGQKPTMIQRRPSPMNSTQTKPPLSSKLNIISKQLPTHSSNIGKIMSLYNSPQSLIAQPKERQSVPVPNPNIDKMNKEGSVRNSNSNSNILKQFVTNISAGSDVVKVPVRPSSVNKISREQPQLQRHYFFDDFVQAHTDHNPANYFHSLLKVYMTQTLQSIMILSKINLKEYKPNGQTMHIEEFNNPYKHKSREPSRPVSPPSSAPKKTIIFDLDETLIHCNEDQNGPCDIRVPVVFPSGEKILAGINIRPHAKEIIEELSNYFEIIVFTASHSCYANPVIDYLDDHRVISARLFRENCSQIANGLYTKDLSVIKNRDLRDLVLVDNAVYSFILNLENGIPIIPYYNNKQDVELVKLKNFLIQLKNVEDVRPYILKYFEWESFVKHGAEPEKLFKKLFK